MGKPGWLGVDADGQGSLSKPANGGLFGPGPVELAAIPVFGFKVFGGAFHGAQEGAAATGADLEDQTVVGKFVGAKSIGRTLAAIPEAFQGSPHPTGMPKVAGAGAQSGETLLLRARAAKIIGAGEEGWKGTAEAPK